VQNQKPNRKPKTEKTDTSVRFGLRLKNAQADNKGIIHSARSAGTKTIVDYYCWLVWYERKILF